MPGSGNPIIIGGGISLGSPADISHFLKLVSADPPAANTSSRLIEDTNSIICLGNGTNSTSIGPSANATQTDGLALGSSVAVTGVNAIGLGKNLTLGNSNQCAVGSVASAAGTYNLASSFTMLGMEHTYSTFPSNSVYLGAQTSGGGNSAVAVGAAVSITGNGGVGIGANAQAGNNSICIGQLATSGTGGSAHNMSIGSGATGPATTNGVMLLGNRNGAGTTGIAAGDIALGHQDNSNSIFSTRLILGGGLSHVANTAVPTFTVRNRQASGTNIAAGDLGIEAPLATGNATGGAILLRTAPVGASGATVQTSVVRLRVEPTGNITLLGATGSYGTGVGVIFIANATTNPTTNPTGGGILYCDAGDLTYRGSGGTTTVLGPA